ELDVAHELLHEERDALRLARDLGRLRCGTCKPPARELARIVVVERIERDIAATGAARIADALDRLAALRRVAAIARAEQHAGRQDIVEQRRALDIAPLEVVDDHDDRPVRGQSAEQLAQRREAATSLLLRIAELATDVASGPDPPQYREQAPERHDVAR